MVAAGDVVYMDTGDSLAGDRELGMGVLADI